MSDAPLYGCRNQGCAEECTWPESDLMEHPDGGPICQMCWEEEKWDYCASEDEFPPSLNRWRSSQSLEFERLQAELSALRSSAHHERVADLEARLADARRSVRATEQQLRDVTAERDGYAKNAAFYRSCVLSGEIPANGDEPYKEPTQ